MFNSGMLGHMNQQQQMALLQMAQLQMAQMSNMKPSSNQPLSMMIPGAGQFVLVPQNQLHQMAQFQDAQLRQLQQQQQHELNDLHLGCDLQSLQQNSAMSKQLPKQDMTNNMRNMSNNMRPKQQPKNVPKNAQKMPCQKTQPRALPKRVLVTKLPTHIKTVEALADVFYPYGIISEIQIFKDRTQLSPGLAEIIAKVDPRPNATPAATVEFETSQAAKFAVSIMRKREKQLQFRVALLKGDSVDEKHCHNYQKATRRVSTTSSKNESAPDNDAFSSSGYDTCSLKSESPRPGEECKSQTNSSDYFAEHSIIQDFENMTVSNGSELTDDGQGNKRNLGPIAPPKAKKIKVAKTGQLSRFRATYKGPQAL